MGLLGDLGKALMGQQPSSENTLTSPIAHIAGNGVIDEHGYKIIPTIEVHDLHSHLQGNHLSVTAWIVNDSDQSVRIDTCYLLKQKRQFNQELSPHGSHQLTLYEGPAPTNENEHSAQIVYRLNVNGDTFQNTYRIDYRLQSGGLRTINQLVNDGKTKDV